jgi:hypothetical protein
VSAERLELVTLNSEGKVPEELLPAGGGGIPGGSAGGGAELKSYGRTSTIAAPTLRDMVSILDFTTLAAKNGNGTVRDDAICRAAMTAINEVGGGLLVITPQNLEGNLAKWLIGINETSGKKVGVEIPSNVTVSAYGAHFLPVIPKGFALTSGTAEGASLLNITGSKAKGFLNGKIVTFTKLDAGVSNLTVGIAYKVLGEATNGFEVELTGGGGAIKVAGAALTAATEIALRAEKALFGNEPAGHTKGEVITKDVRWLGGAFEGNGQEAENQGPLEFWRGEDISVRDVKVTSWGKLAFSGVFTFTDSHRIRVESCNLIGCCKVNGRNAIDVFSTEATAPTGAHPSTYSEIVIANNIVTGGGAAPICAQVGVESRYVNTVPLRVLIVNNICESLDWNAIILEAGGVRPEVTMKQIIISGNTAVYAGANAGSNWGINVVNDGSKDRVNPEFMAEIKITNNIVESNRNGIGIQGSRITCEGNTVTATNGGIVVEPVGSGIAFAPTANTAIGSGVINLTGALNAGWVNNFRVSFNSITGGVTGLATGVSYFVVGAATNSFELSLTEGGPAVLVAGHELETGSTKLQPANFASHVLIKNGTVRLKGEGASSAIWLNKVNDSSVEGVDVFFEEEVERKDHGLLLQNCERIDVVVKMTRSATQGILMEKCGSIHINPGTRVRNPSDETTPFTPTANTVIGSSVINLTGAKGKGFLNGKKVSMTLTAGVTGLVQGVNYFVVGEATNSFELSLTEGGAAVKVEGHELEAASSKAFFHTSTAGVESITATGPIYIEGTHITDSEGNMSVGIKNTTPEAAGLVYSMRNIIRGWRTAAWSGTMTLQLDDIIDESAAVWRGERRETWVNNASPATGTWAVGDKANNRQPAAKGTLLWVCVTAGTPGTWEAVSIP